MQGTIKKVMSQRGYGFIDTESQDDDLFFHKSNLDNIEFSSLTEGTSVEFDIADGRKGPEAVNIKLSSGAAEEPVEEAPSDDE
ncbi:MAG: cold shock domain-containing protein [Promethearchaeota archaeon]|jgi:CspA family cold shock protein